MRMMRTVGFEKVSSDAAGLHRSQLRRELTFTFSRLQRSFAPHHNHHNTLSYALTGVVSTLFVLSPCPPWSLCPLRFGDGQASCTLPLALPRKYPLSPHPAFRMNHIACKGTSMDSITGCGRRESRGSEGSAASLFSPASVSSLFIFRAHCSLTRRLAVATQQPRLPAAPHGIPLRLPPAQPWLPLVRAR